MPNRILRDGILTSDAVNLLDAPGEVFYRRLMSVVDDFGRFDARPSILRAACYPLRIEKVREADISRWLHELETAGLIVLYEFDSKPYLEFMKLGKPRAATSRFPSPQNTSAVACAQMNSDVAGKKKSFAEKLRQVSTR